jgi:peptidoglycan hydrolase-like protein with peptidoglycan-binding domain
MSRYTIRERVGAREEIETTFRGLEKHHPSSGREPGRDYATIDGELEEIRRTSDGRTLIKKDFYLTRDDGGRIDIPAPVAGYIHYPNLPGDRTNAVRIYDRPFGEPGARLLAQSLHMERGTSPPQGSRIEYGQPMGRMGDTGSPGSVHAHVEAEHGQFTRYIADIAAGRIAPGVWPARGNAPAPGGTAPSPGGAMADGVLREGEQGAEVRSLQQRLNQLGMRDARGQPLVVDSDFGDRTREAVERFQRSRGIAVDGVVGRDTFRELGEAVREQSQRPGAPAPTPTTPAPAPAAPTAPGGAQPPSRLSNLIGSGEGGYNSYNRGVAGDSGGREIDFSQMTVGEIMRRQDLPRNDPQRLFAVGKFQIIPDTMEETVRALGIDRNARFTPALQERMFHDYLIDEKRPAVRAFITAPDGQGTPALQQRAQIALAQEFASVADPRTGRSYYDGDSAGNASSITARQSAEALSAMRTEYRAAIARGASPDDAWRQIGGGVAPGQNVPGTGTPAPTTPGAPTRPGAPAGGGAMADGVLRQGEQGIEVRSVQHRLNQLGVLDSRGQTLVVDGDFGDRTREAVERFQRSRGIAVDGVVGRDTFRELGEAVRERGSRDASVEAPQRSVLTGREAPLLTAADHPDRALMQQARAGIERLPAGSFSSDRERDQAAAALVFEAKIAGLTRIDAVTPNVSGTGLFAVQGRADDPGAQRVYVDRAQVANQTVEQSTQMLRQASPAAESSRENEVEVERRAVAARSMA